MIFARAFAVWLIIITVETFHGILRNKFLVPLTDDFRARQISVFTGALLIFIVTFLFIEWLKAINKSQLYFIGIFWVCLTIIFEISLGKILGYSWNRILSDYKILKGGFMSIGLILMMLSPYIASKIRKLI